MAAAVITDHLIRIDFVIYSIEGTNHMNIAEWMDTLEHE